MSGAVGSMPSLTRSGSPLREPVARARPAGGRRPRRAPGSPRRAQDRGSAIGANARLSARLGAAGNNGRAARRIRPPPARPVPDPGSSLRRIHQASQRARSIELWLREQSIRTRARRTSPADRDSTRFRGSRAAPKAASAAGNGADGRELTRLQQARERPDARSPAETTRRASRRAREQREGGRRREPSSGERHERSGASPRGDLAARAPRRVVQLPPAAARRDAGQGRRSRG